MSSQSRRHSEKGNILFLILLAVILFAALSYAVTQSLRGGGQDASNEKNIVKGAQIMQYPVGIRAAILRMIVGGTNVNTLNFDPPSQFASMSDAQKALNVFHPTGGARPSPSFLRKLWPPPPPRRAGSSRATSAWSTSARRLTPPPTPARI